MATFIDQHIFIKYREYLRRKMDTGVITVNAKGCHIWNGATSGGSDSAGRYGVCRISWDGGSRTIYTHQLSYGIEHGQLPQNDLQVSHLCHNRLCCNPHHLTAESQSDNSTRANCVAQNQCIRHGLRPACML